jgi:hypothetical protein
MARTPRISFTFPIRWLKDPEDRKFLHENLARQAGGGRNKNVMNAALADAMSSQGQGLIMAYQVVLKTHAYQPVTYKFNEKDAEKAFKDVLPGARCMSLTKFFVQTSDLSALPVMEIEVYY